LLETLLDVPIPGLYVDVIKFRLQARYVIHLDESPDDMAGFLPALDYKMYITSVLLVVLGWV